MEGTIKKGATLFLGLFLVFFLSYLMFMNTNKKDETDKINKKEEVTVDEITQAPQPQTQIFTEKALFNIVFWGFEEGLKDIIPKDNIEDIKEKIKEEIREEYLDVEYLSYLILTQDNELIFYADCDEELVLQISYENNEITIGKTNYLRADIEKKKEEQRQEEIKKYIEGMYP